MKKVYTLFFLCIVAYFYSQQKISGRIIDEDQNNLGSVLIFNVSKNLKALSNSAGVFYINAEENDELRFVKEGFYRKDRMIKKEDFDSGMTIILSRAETLIEEVEIEFKPTGNLKKDVQHFDDSKKVADLKSSLRNYMDSELNEPLPKNVIPKSFQGHDFNAGQINLVKAAGAVVGLIKKAAGHKITTPNYVETQNFLKKVKAEVNLEIFRKYGMDEEKIDHFLTYAEQVNHLSKKYRNDFNANVILSELQNAFVEYSKLNKLSD